MKVNELIDLLRELDVSDDGVDVVIQRQPSWPIIAHIAGVVRNSDGQVVILEGDDIGYGDKRLYQDQAESSSDWGD